MDTDTVMNVHIGSSGRLAITAPDAPMDVMITLQPMNIVQAAADLLWSAPIKEYPTLKIALSEGGTGWIPYFLDRVDRTYEMHSTWTDQDFGGKMPSEVFREHFMTCFISDPVGVKNCARDRHRQHLLGDGLPALRFDVARCPRGTRRGVRDLRRARRRDQQDDPRERDAAGTTSSRSPTSPKTRPPSARCARPPKDTTSPSRPCRHARTGEKTSFQDWAANWTERPPVSRSDGGVSSAEVVADRQVLEPADEVVAMCSGVPASSIDFSRGSSSEKKLFISIRASAAPRQKCTP